MQSLCKKIHTADDDIINIAEQNIFVQGPVSMVALNNFLTLDVGPGLSSQRNLQPNQT
jgi:hypothetical protein